jgi:hypothetical protein
MRLPRMTTRRWMVLVAVVAILLGGLVLARRWRERLATAQGFLALERATLASIQSFEQSDPASKPWAQLNQAQLRVQLRHSRRERERYARAVRYPWLPGPPDPPEPK